jgi:hypothetical protein
VFSLFQVGSEEAWPNYIQAQQLPQMDVDTDFGQETVPHACSHSGATVRRECLQHSPLRAVAGTEWCGDADALSVGELVLIGVAAPRVRR